MWEDCDSIIDVPPFRDDPAINLCHGYTLHRLWYDRAVQEVEKHFVQDLGARPQHGADREDYEEGGGENDTYMDIQNFDENWLGSMVSGQPDDLDFGLSEDMEALDVGGRHLGSQGTQRGFYEDDEEEYELDDFWTRAVVRWTPGVYVSIKVDFFEKLNFTSFSVFKQNTLQISIFGRKLHLFKW